MKCYKIMDRTGFVVGAKAVNRDNEVMMINTEGIIIQMPCEDISILGRVTSGVKLMNLGQDAESKVASIAKVKSSEAKNENDETNSQEEEQKEE